LVGPHVGAILGVCIFHFILKRGQADAAEMVSSSSIDPRHWQHFNTHPPDAEQEAHYPFPEESHKSRIYNMKTL
jgi:hypothetical protein